MSRNREFQLNQHSGSLVAGAQIALNMLEYFALTSGAGLQVMAKGRGRFVALEPYNVVGDGEDVLGTVVLYNPTGSTVAYTILTSSRAFNPTALSNTSNVNVTNSSLTVALTGNASVVGPGANGAAVSGNPVRVAGSDGTNTRDVLTDTNGRQLVAGAAANGAAVAGNPVLVAGSDGANARSLAVTSSGLPRVNPEAVATGGATRFRLRAAATTNATSIKASAGKVYGFTASNPSAAAKFLKLFDKASAPTVGTDTPTLVVLVPAGATVHADYGVGENHATGIALAITGGEPDSDATAVAAGDLHVTLRYA